MSERRQKKRKPRRGKRHPLLLQRRFNEQVFWPGILIVACCAALLIWNPAELEPYRRYLIPVLAATGLILVLTFLFRLRAYAQCRAGGLRLQFPFYRLTIPYAEIRTTRPAELYHLFPPAAQRWTQRRFLEPIWGRTGIVVEMERLSPSRHWLRLWMSKYMFPPDGSGLVVSVPDWMGFRADLDEFTFQQRRR